MYDVPETVCCSCLAHRYSRIGTLYFDSEKLKDWSAASHQTMALFERIRTVGKGAVKSML